VIGGIREKISLGFAEYGRTAPVALGEDHLIEEGDGWVGGGFRLALVDELVERLGIVSWKPMIVERRCTLSLHQDLLYVFRILVGQTADESIHVKAVEHPGFLLILTCWLQKLPVGVEESGETPCKGSPYLLWMESCRADNTNLVCAPAVSMDTTPAAFVDPVLGLLIAESADRLFVMRPPLQTMPLYPMGGIGITDRLD